jgi:glycosyltransferase involved in cell wall biosynthesis
LKILHAVEFYHPVHGGSQEVVRRISEGLVRKGHEVTVVTSKNEKRGCVSEINGVRIKEFEVAGKIAYGMTGEIEAYRNFMVQSDFDIILIYSAQQWTFDALLPVLNQIKGSMFLVPCGFSGLHLREFQQYFKELPKYLSRFERLIFMSQNYRDYEFCAGSGFTNLDIIPNGCSSEEFEQSASPEEKRAIRKKFGIPDEDFLIFHVGSHTGIKGHREAIKIFNRAKLKGATLVIVGNVFDRNCEKRCKRAALISTWRRRWGLSRSNVLVTEMSRADTVSMFKAADLFLFPSNIECSPIVLFEAMASGTPFLVTDVGNSAELAELSAGGEVIETLHPTRQDYVASVADTQDGVSRLRALHKDEALRRFYGKNGRQTWMSRYTWEKITDCYEAEYLRKK